MKAILCNFFINLSMLVVYSGNAKSDVAKMIAMYLGVFAFVYLGLEHSVANSVLFAMTFWYDLIHGTSILVLSDAFWNVVIALIGNLIGGGVLIGAYYSFLNDSGKIK